MDYLVLKWIHILSSTLLFGTGLGSAFYKWSADRSKDLAYITHTNKTVVLADWLFTTPTVIIQPLTGYLLIKETGYSLYEPWLIATYILYLVAGLCWLPVVWLQIKMRNASLSALKDNSPLNKSYSRDARIWFWLGIPAFSSMIMIYFLMIFKPTI